MRLPVIQQLHEEGHISGDTLKKAAELESARLFSIYWELRLLLYLGVLLLIYGAGGSLPCHRQDGGGTELSGKAPGLTSSYTKLSFGASP